MERQAHARYHVSHTILMLVSRALGIPCRVVTNYWSAHDSNSNLTIERYIDEKGDPIQSGEMIW